MGYNEEYKYKKMLEEIERKSKMTKEEIEAEEKSEKRMTVGCLIVILVLIFGVVFWFLDRGTRSNVSDTPTQSHTAVSNNTPSISNEKLQEMRTAYNQVLADTLKPIYVGSAIRNENWVNVYVNSLWYELNKGQKTEFINRCKNTYFGMFGARGIKLNPNTVNIFINLNTNEKILGKWSTFGVSINE